MDAKLLLVLMGIVKTASGAVSYGLIETELVHGETVKFCTYKGMRLLPTSDFVDYDACEKCQCGENGLSCQSVGTYVASAVRGTKCKNVKIACQTTWVLRSDTKRKCPKHLMPISITAVGK
ncbi:beta-microseminoprotein-like [Dreissena polymorpha]|nr:beta-microseminoprotein-like [Dreissena polymorpha]